ncbi:MAG: hypothetical protein Q8L44_05080 [Sulfuritalea sp.]|nr:hypothetical protein [Sulfuritalea sp.]
MKRAHIIPMTSGDEFDVLTRWRHVYHWKPGTRKAIKRGYRRRQRAMERGQLMRGEEIGCGQI